MIDLLIHRHIQCRPSQQAQYVGPMLIQWWASVIDGGPTLGQHRANIVCLLGLYVNIKLEDHYQHNNNQLVIVTILVLLVF